MPNKRSHRKKIQQFFCPHCKQRLWRAGGRKYYMFYEDVIEIKQGLGITRKKATLLAAQGTYVNKNSWIEEFFCGEHGSMWLLITRKDGGELVSEPAIARHWQQTTHTIDPNLPNPSVSEFSYRMSRRACVRFSSQ